MQLSFCILLPACLCVCVCVRVCNFLLSLGDRTVSKLQRATGELLGPSLSPDNEIRLQRPPSLRYSLTYLCRTDALCSLWGRGIFSIFNNVPLQ